MICAFAAAVFVNYPAQALVARADRVAVMTLCCSCAARAVCIAKHKQCFLPFAAAAVTHTGLGGEGSEGGCGRIVLSHQPPEIDKHIQPFAAAVVLV
jgi:hypothetical protein